VTVGFVLIGGGGHARVLLDLLRALGHPVLGFVDADPASAHLPGTPCLGRDDDLAQQWPPSRVELVNALGSTRTTRTRRAAYERFAAAGYRFPSLVHPSAVLAPDVTLASGVQVMAGAIVQTGVRVAENSILNTGVLVDHDCDVGPHAHLAPGVTLSGSVLVGPSAHVGTGATVVQGVRLGSACLVGAGSVVVRDVPGGATVMQRSRVADVAGPGGPPSG
jgi:sugar O-acyltransferase (sialic acid O-acetyltransferase NeuD family)